MRILNSHFRFQVALLTCSLLFLSEIPVMAQSSVPTEMVLLVMDVQESVIKRTNTSAVVDSVAKLIAVARQQNVPVIYVRAGFRKGAPEISDNNKFFSANRSLFANADPDQWMVMPQKIAPSKSDIIIDKRRYSSFEGTDLEMICNAKNFKHLVLCGITTSGVVLSTVLDAADKDFKVTVISSACADPDSDVEKMLMTKVFPKLADVMTIDEWARSIYKKMGGNDKR